MLLNDGELILHAAREGLGLAYLLENTVREDLASKRLVKALDAYSQPFPGFFL